MSVLWVTVVVELGCWVSGADCVKVVTEMLSWGGFYVSQSLGPPVSLTGVRRTPIMGA